MIVDSHTSGSGSARKNSTIVRVAKRGKCGQDRQRFPSTLRHLVYQQFVLHYTALFLFLSISVYIKCVAGTNKMFPSARDKVGKGNDGSGLGFVAQQVVIPISKFALMRALTLSVTGIYNKSTPLTHPLQISTRLPSFLHRFFHISQNLLTMSTNAQYNLLNFFKATRKLSSWKVFYISHTKHLHRSLLVVFDEVIETAETAKEIP